MAILPADTMNEILKRSEHLEAEMAKGPEHEVYARLAAEYSGLEDVVAAIRAYHAATRERADLKGLLDDPSADREMRDLAAAEMDELADRIETLSDDILILLLPKDAADEKGAILEIRAGTGGSEAALFAGDLFRTVSYTHLTLPTSDLV